MAEDFVTWLTVAARPVLVESECECNGAENGAKDRQTEEEFGAFGSASLEVLSAPVLCALEQASEIQDVHAGHIFFRPGETGRAIFVVEDGRVQTYRALGSKKLLIAELKAGGVFGEIGCVGQGLYHCTAEAMQPSRVRSISRIDLEHVLEKHPGVLRRLLDLVGQRFFNVLMDLEATSFRTLIPRIAALLLKTAEGDSVRDVTHQEIAERLHVYRESTTEALGALRKAGIIAMRRKQIRILDRERLERASREGA